MFVFMIFPALIAGGLTLAGGVAANRWRAGAARKDRRFQRAQTQTQMMFQERMRNTQWQAGIADMEAAGVNPAIAFSQGGASAPMGAAAGGSKAEVDDIVGTSVSSAMQARRMRADLKVLTAQEKNISEDTFLKQQARHTSNALAAKYDVEMRAMKHTLPGLQNIERFERGPAGQGSALFRALVRAARGSS